LILLLSLILETHWKIWPQKFIHFCPKSLRGETGLYMHMLTEYEAWAMHILQVGCSTWLKAIILKKGYSRVREGIIQMWKLHFTTCRGTNQN